MPVKTATHLVNHNIRAVRVRLIGADGVQRGIVPLAVALYQASEEGLDLVQMAEGDPPVVRIANYARMRYELEQSAKDARRHQTRTTVKEIKMRPVIDDHDYETKRAAAERFLRHGDKAKVTIMFRGREQSRPETGQRLLERLAEDLKAVASVESQPRLDGRSMIMLLGPTGH